MQGPETFLRQLQVELPSPVDPSATAQLSPELRTVVNGHFFWVAGEAELETFRAEPASFTGPLLDPTHHTWFDPGGDSPRLDVEGEILLFASVESRSAYAPEAPQAGGGELDFGSDRPALPSWARHVHGTPGTAHH